MAIDFGKTFGANSNNVQSNSVTAQNRPKAQYWLNIGYLTNQVDETGEKRFVSLASGISLDTMETLQTNSKNATFGMFQAARNELRDQLVAEAAKNLKPGEASVTEPIASFFDLQIQVRRVSEEVAAPTGDSNPFVRKLVA